MSKKPEIQVEKAYKQCANYGRNFELEKIISTSAKYSYLYSHHVKRFELGEPAISQDAGYSYLYAADTLKDRFKLGEEIISKHPEFAYKYARDIIGRFELGEEAISKNNGYSLLYAKDVLNGRFELGEKAISNDAHCSCLYARDVIKGRFELGEKTISKDGQFSYKYAHEVLKGRFELGEPVLLQSNYLINYITHVIKAPWPEAEYILSDRIIDSTTYAQCVLKSRFYLAEPNIAKHSIYSNQYANILKSRFKLGESKIMSDMNLRKSYLTNIIGLNHE